MFTFDIIVQNVLAGPDEPIADALVSAISEFLTSLERCGQILYGEHHISLRGDVAKIAVVCPEIDSLDVRYCNDYAFKWLTTIEQATRQKVAFSQTGIEPELTGRPAPKTSSHYVLRQG